MTIENSENRRRAIIGLENFLWDMENNFEALRSGRIVVFGHGRLSGVRQQHEEVQISGDDIRNLPEADNQDDEIES